MSKHATDRWDWTLIAECPNNGEQVEGETDPTEDNPEHITIESSAENCEMKALEALPVDDMPCGICGADLDIVVEQTPTEILE